ncbi:MAG: NAD-binding protein [Treponema sp.]|nr:NAD-binding protein [Treponema sp.]
MKIVIVGAGFTGRQLAKKLINERNEVVLIDNSEEVVRHASNSLDCDVKEMDGNNLENLEEVGIGKADALVCVTANDEVNMITCSLVDSVYPDILKIARVRNFSYYMNTAAAVKKHAETFSGKHRPLYGIDFMVNPDIEAAEAVVHAVESGAVSDVVTFENSEYEISRITIAQGAPLAGQQLKSVRKLTSKPFLIAYVESGEKTSLPSGPTVLNAGDSIGVLSRKEDIGDLLALCGASVESLDKIALVGAGRIGTLIADRLIKKQDNSFLSKFFGKRVKVGKDFAIVDQDDAYTKEASERYPNARVFKGDITDESFLREEGLTEYDLVICATHNRELNMVVAAYLESLGVGRSVSLVESSTFAQIARKLGVDVPVPLRDTVVDSIMSHLRGKSVTGIHTVSEGQLEIVECVLSPSSKLVGKTLLDIANPGAFLVMLEKKAGSQNYVIPVGSTTLDANDQLIIITLAEETEKLLKLFGAETK